ncbi:hypothetical protein NXT3_PA00308 (plasmid) [Sinorhizobium fredii]|uniref:Uncharacterized protein n=1 Tax=Rhizobium fredii TaxID=380 RepID=A0A2L0HAT0_RHIFR|nr:hypothetical protein NXT3_PA00308 [Sinorhizobium fredii]
MLQSRLIWFCCSAVSFDQFALISSWLEEGHKFKVIGSGAVYLVDASGVSHSNIAAATLDHRQSVGWATDFPLPGTRLQAFC